MGQEYTEQHSLHFLQTQLSFTTTGYMTAAINLGVSVHIASSLFCIQSPHHKTRFAYINIFKCSANVQEFQALVQTEQYPLI
jgi:hypothetical protein